MPPVGAGAAAHTLYVHRVYLYVHRVFVCTPCVLICTPCMCHVYSCASVSSFGVFSENNR